MVFRISKNGDGRRAWLDPDDVKQQICNNLVAAGVLREDETPRYLQQLEKYEHMELIRVLVYSHELKELDEQA